MYKDERYLYLVESVFLTYEAYREHRQNNKQAIIVRIFTNLIIQSHGKLTKKAYVFEIA